jgi:hypothetical protein
MGHAGQFDTRLEQTLGYGMGAGRGEQGFVPNPLNLSPFPNIFHWLTWAYMIELHL